MVNISDACLADCTIFLLAVLDNFKLASFTTVAKQYQDSKWVFANSQFQHANVGCIDLSIYYKGAGQTGPDLEPGCAHENLRGLRLLT